MRWLRRRPTGADHERGYVIVWVAATMVVLLGVTGFAVDLGFWYHRAAQLQNAADAGALGGVVYLPGDFPQASAVAGTTVGKNVTGAGAAASKVPGHSRRLNVCVGDDDVDRFFSSIFLQNQLKIRRCATAEYILPVALGSPLNKFDHDVLGMRPAINGYCTAKEDGDLRSSRYRANRPESEGGSTVCPPQPGGQTNADYDPNGYFFAVDLAQPAPSAVAIEVRHASFNPDDGVNDLALGSTVTPQSFATSFTVYDATETPLDYSDDPVVADVLVPSRDNWWNGWRQIAVIPAGTVGRYRVQVRTLAVQPATVGSNGFGIRARHTSGAFQLCSTVEGASNHSASCPKVSGEDAISVYASSSGSTAEFYLAEVDPVHAGKQMVISLFDPGEGGQTIEVLDPNGNPVTFSYETDDDLPPPHSGTTSALNISGEASLPHRVSGWKFNERMLKLTIELPGDYTDRYDGKAWWKLRYRFGSGRVSDRTTWAVNIVGDPVRLVPNP